MKRTPEQAFQQLSALCAQAEHCQQEMLDKMKRWGLIDEEQAAVMERLVRGHYVDDERYCRAFVRDKIKYNKWGRRKVEQALWPKHINADVCHRVLDEIDEKEYVCVLKPLLQQKRRSVRGANAYEQRMKLVKWALSRGFGMDIIRQCMDVDEDGDEFPDEDF